MLNVSGLFSNFVINDFIFQNGNIPRLKKDKIFLTDIITSFPTTHIENDLVSIPPINLDSKPSLSIQQINITPILDVSGDKTPYSLDFIENIWKDVPPCGSDLIVINNSSSYQNGLIVTNSTVFPIDETITTADLADMNNSLFVRIGNNGYGRNYTIPEDENAPTENITGGISAGWQIDFSIEDNFDVIYVSFKWRFDAPDMVFDIYNDSLPWYLNTDTSDDYQEVRCRIKHPDSDQSSFWMGDAINQTNPNGTVFYRVGPIVEKDDEWYFFNYSFHLPPTDDITLELGAYLNTREVYNEYFDVWFDDILIQGVNNITDNLPPQPTSFDLSRTEEDVSRWEFWADLAEGTWETPIKNVTVFFYEENQSTIILNRSLSLVNSSLNQAGYNQTYWQYYEYFTFGENITFKMLIYDEAGNYKETAEKSTEIGDFEPPEIITSPLTVNNSNFVHQLGNGTILVRVNTRDWGDATDNVQLNYTLKYKNGTSYQNKISMSKSGTEYQATLFVSYKTLLEFRIQLTDTAGNSREYPAPGTQSWFTLESDVDNIPPLVDFIVNASDSEEGRTFVYVDAEDPFGEIDNQSVFLVIEREDGTPHPSSPIYLVKNVTGKYEYKLGTRLYLEYAEVYNMTVFVRDQVGWISNSSYPYPGYVVPDTIAPKVTSESIELEYTYPGLLRVWVLVSDLGSGISSVTLERETEDGWSDPITLSKKGNRFYIELQTDLIGNEQYNIRINAIDNEGNHLEEEDRPIRKYTTKIFFSTVPGLVIAQALIVFACVSMFTTIKVIQLRRLRVRRRKRFDIALGRSERLAYLGEEAIFGFVAAYSQKEGVSSILMWEPRLIGHFYQYLKELTDKANNTIAFIMQTKPQDHVTFVDFYIEKIGCTAHTFAYPVTTIPQQWLSTLTLDQVPLSGGQGTLLIMLIMREKWGEIANNFQEEITDGVVELRDLIVSGEEKQAILEKAREFRLFISGTLEVLDEIEIETDEVSDEIMGDFDSEFLDEPEEDAEEELEEYDSSELSFDDNMDA